MMTKKWMRFRRNCQKPAQTETDSVKCENTDPADSRKKEKVRFAGKHQLWMFAGGTDLFAVLDKEKYQMKFYLLSLTIRSVIVLIGSSC